MNIGGSVAGRRSLLRRCRYSESRQVRARRHDLAAIVAYGDYRRSLVGDVAVGTSPGVDPGETLAISSATSIDQWEDEGGHVALGEAPGRRHS